MVWSNAPVTTSALPPISACSALRAAGEIGDFDVEALVLEVAEPVGDGERQVIERVLAADREPHFGLRAARSSRRRRQRQRQQRDHAPHAVPLARPYVSSMRAHSLKLVMSLNPAKSTPSLPASGLPALMSASARSMVRATRKISVVG